MARKVAIIVEGRRVEVYDDECIGKFFVTQDPWGGVYEVVYLKGRRPDGFGVFGPACAYDGSLSEGTVYDGDIEYPTIESLTETFPNNKAVNTLLEHLA